MTPIVLLDTGASGRLWLEERDGRVTIEATGTLWPAVAELLERARVDALAASAIEERKDLPGDKVVIEPPSPGPHLEQIRAVWLERYEEPTLCVVRRPGRDDGVTLPREALQDFLYELNAAQAQLDAQSARQKVRAELLAWANALPRAELPDPERLPELEARVAQPPEDDEGRRALLLALHAQGLLDDSRRSEKETLLSAYPALLSWFQAAVEAARYLRSEAREKVLKEPAPPLLASAVTLDWFRLGPYTHAGADPDEYLAWREYGVLHSEDLTNLAAGNVFTNDMGPIDTVVFRSDNGRTRALVRGGQRIGGEVATNRLHPDVRLEEAADKCLQSGAADVALLLLPALVQRAPMRTSAAELLERARAQAPEPAEPARAIEILRQHADVLAIPEQTEPSFAPLIAQLLLQGSEFEQRYTLKRLRPFASHPDVLAALDELRRSGRSASLEPHFSWATGSAPAAPPSGDGGSVPQASSAVPRETSSVPRGAPPSSEGPAGRIPGDERLFGPEFWIVGVGSAILLILVYFLARG